MSKSGWKVLLPAAFFFVVNFSLSQNKYLFARQLIFFSLFCWLFFLLRGFSLQRLLPPIVCGLSLLFFTYGIIQKLFVFPSLLERIPKDTSYFNIALRTRIESGRIFSIFPLPTLYSMVCGILLLFIVHYLVQSPKNRAWIWMSIASMGFFNLLMTKSFGGILSFSLSLAAYAAIRRRIQAKYLVSAGMILFLILLIVVGMRFSEAKSLEPLRLRFSNWMQASRLIASSPIFGIGLGNYSIAVPPHIRQNEVSAFYAHNFFLQFVAEAGALSFFFLFSLVTGFLMKRWKTMTLEENAPFSAGLLLLLVFNTFDMGIYFIACGITASVCLSQIFPQKKPRLVFLFPTLISLLFLQLCAHADNLQIQGDISSATNQPEKAREMYLRCLGINAFSHQSLIGLANLDMAVGNTTDAEKRLHRALALAPQSGKSHFLLSRLKYRQGWHSLSLYHAMKAKKANQKQAGYKKWYDLLNQNFQNQLDQRGN